MAVSMNISCRPANDIEKTLGKHAPEDERKLQMNLKEYKVDVDLNPNVVAFQLDVQFGELNSKLDPVVGMAVSRLGLPRPGDDGEHFNAHVNRHADYQKTAFSIAGDDYVIQGNFKHSVVALRDFYKTQTDGERTLEVRMQQRR